MDWQAEELLEGLDEPVRYGRAALLDELHADGVPVEELGGVAARERGQPLDRARPARVRARHERGAGRDRDGACAWSDAGEKKLKGLSAPVTAYRARRP
jgi:hypothetical protein